ncbi:MAG: hypothetical protein GY908_06390 [Flavobacteriales bacterium]|nr:hypothetical protein [Flavobacteriales bacterium]
MIRTYFVYLLFVFLCLKTMAQNMQILYDFDQMPQTLLLNPGSIVDYDKHIGVPLLSNIYAMGGSSSRDINYNNLVAGTEGNTKILRNLRELGLSNDELFIFNQQIELLNGGFRLRNPDYYLSFGMYQQINGFSSYSQDLVDLYLYGNDQNQDGRPEFDQRFKANSLNAVFDILGVFHVGINKKINKNFNFGGRLKLLSGSIGLETSANKGNYTLNRGNAISDPYIHNYDNISVRINTSGFLEPSALNDDLGSRSEIIGGLFFLNGSMGLAIDLGFTYKASDEFIFSGSLLDLGMISFKHKQTRVQLEEAVIPSEDFYDPNGGLDYWRSLYLANELPLITDDKDFSYARSPKVNGAVRYEMRRKVKQDQLAMRNVRADLSSDYLTSSFGMQVFTEFRPKYPVWAVTGFYSRELTKVLSAKATYTVDKFSYYNIGLGISAHIKSFNIYATADNLVALASIKNSNYQSFQIGMNFIFF